MYIDTKTLRSFIKRKIPINTGRQQSRAARAVKMRPKIFRVIEELLDYQLVSLKNVAVLILNLYLHKKKYIYYTLYIEAIGKTTRFEHELALSQ